MLGPSSWSNGALVILARLQRDDGPAIGEGQDAGLLAVEPLLDDEAVAGLPEDAPNHDLLDAVERLAEVVAHEDALAGGQSVGLEDEPQGPAEHEVAGLGGGAEHPFLAPFLDLDLHAGAEHLARVHDPVDGLERLGGGAAVEGVADRRAAARSDDQGDLTREGVVLGVRRGAENAVIGRGDARLTHQVLGEDLAPLQLRGFLARAEDAEVFPLEDVDDPLDERLLRPDDRQTDAFSLGELDQAADVSGLDRHIMDVEGGPGVAGGAVDRRGPARLLEFPAEGVLTPPLADH